MKTSNTKSKMASMSCLMQPANFQPTTKPRITIYDPVRLQAIRAKNFLRLPIEHIS